MAIGINWAEIWAPVWKAVWTQTPPPAPVFGGPIADISVTENTGTHSYDLGANFTGATSYSIAPAIESGWTFDTITGELEIDTDAVGVFGPYVITGTNGSGSDDSNGFTVTVVAAVATEEPTGGWDLLSRYEAELKRRRREAKRRRELEEETERIEDALDKEIAQLLRVQERKDERRNELNRLKALAKSNSDIEAAAKYSPRVAAAMADAIQKGTTSALDRLDRELRKAREEEEAAIVSMLLLLE